MLSWAMAMRARVSVRASNVVAAVQWFLLVAQHWRGDGPEELQAMDRRCIVDERRHGVRVHLRDGDGVEDRG